MKCCFTNFNTWCCHLDYNVRNLYLPNWIGLKREKCLTKSWLKCNFSLTKNRLKRFEFSSTKTWLKRFEFSSTKTRLKLWRIEMTKMWLKLSFHLKTKTKTKSKTAAKINTGLRRVTAALRFWSGLLRRHTLQTKLIITVIFQL